jgi:RecB family endonuclease NucS
MSYLNRIDRTIGGLDEAIRDRGIDAVSEWGRTTNEPPFDTYAANARSSLKRYLSFSVSKAVSEDEIDVGYKIDEEENSSFFKIEREMQAAVRAQLSQIEKGLVEADGGFETITSTGRVDILARDASNVLVAIELKAGLCPMGALEQVLGYAQALSEERNERVRAILIASSFPDRVLAAAKRATDTVLLRYSFTLSFSAVA